MTVDWVDGTNTSRFTICCAVMSACPSLSCCLLCVVLVVSHLQDMTKYDRIKTLIDRFDPDARPAQPAMQHQGEHGGGGGGGGGGGWGRMPIKTLPC